MKTLLTALLILVAGSAMASTVTTTTIAITNTAGTTNGQTLTVNSDVRTWTNNVVVAASQILTNNTQAGAAANLLGQVAINPFSGLQLFQSGMTNIVLRSAPNGTITATVSAGWATVTSVTNTLGLGIVVRVPPTIETAAEQTNIWSEAALGFLTSTNPITLNTGGTNSFGSTIFTDPSLGSFLFKRASDGVTIGVFDGSALTNLVGTVSTNVINTGVFSINQYWLTNITGNITLGAFAGVPANLGWQLWIRATNSDTSVRTVTFPPGCVGSGDGAPMVSYITNASARVFWVLGFGNKATNVFDWPAY